VGLPAGEIRELLGSTTTVYLSTFDSFTTGSVSAFGFIGCRRMR
jgi:hypothetical protein